MVKSKGLQPRLLYPARLSFKIEGEIRSFSDKKKLKEFANTKPVLQQMLKGLLEEEGGGGGGGEGRGRRRRRRRKSKKKKKKEKEKETNKKTQRTTV